MAGYAKRKELRKQLLLYCMARTQQLAFNKRVHFENTKTHDSVFVALTDFFVTLGSLK